MHPLSSVNSEKDRKTWETPMDPMQIETCNHKGKATFHQYFQTSNKQKTEVFSLETYYTGYRKSKVKV